MLNIVSSSFIVNKDRKGAPMGDLKVLERKTGFNGIKYMCPLLLTMELYTTLD